MAQKSWREQAAKGSLWVALAAAMGFLGIGSGEIKELLDLQTASGAEHAHKLQRAYVDALQERLLEKIEELGSKMDRQHERTIDAIMDLH